MTDQTTPPRGTEPLTVDEIVREHRRLSAEIAAIEGRIEELEERAEDSDAPEHLARLSLERGALYRARDALKGGTREQLLPLAEAAKARRAELKRLQDHLETLDTQPVPELPDLLEKLDAERARVMAAVSLGDAAPSALAKLDKDRERLEREHVAARSEADRAGMLRLGLLDLIATARADVADLEHDYQVGLHRVLIAELDRELEAYARAASAMVDSWRRVTARVAAHDRLSRLNREKFGLGVSAGQLVAIPRPARADQYGMPSLEHDWREKEAARLHVELADQAQGIPI